MRGLERGLVSLGLGTALLCGRVPYQARPLEAHDSIEMTRMVDPQASNWLGRLATSETKQIVDESTANVDQRECRRRERRNR